MKLKELRERQQKLVADARAKLEEITNETTEARAAEIQTEYDGMMAEYDRLEVKGKQLELLAEREASLEERMTAADPRRPNGESRDIDAVNREARQSFQTATPEQKEQLYRDAFNGFLRYGDHMSHAHKAILRARQDEVRTFVGQGVGGADGGYGQYLVAQAFMAELMKSLKLYGPMMDGGVVRMIETATGASMPWPTMDDTANQGALIAENTQVSLSEIDFGTKNLDAYKYTTGVILVSSELLQDSALDVEGIVRGAMAERIGRIGNNHLSVADGSSKPHGIVHAAGTYAAAAAGAISFDDLIGLEHSVDPAYRSDPSCRFMMNDSTIKALRLLKDGEGRYIWQPADVKAGTPATINGFSYSVNNAMAAVATGNKSVVFGAFNRYVVRMVKQFAIRRLVERYADFDQTGFIGFARFDGELIDGGAVKALTHP